MNVRKEIQHIDIKLYGDIFLNSLDTFCFVLLSTLSALESGMRQFHPPALPRLREALSPFEERLKLASKDFLSDDFPIELKDIMGHLGKAFDYALNSITRITEPIDPREAVQSVMKGMRQHYRAQEALFPLREVLRPVNRYFLEQLVRDKLDDYSKESSSSKNTGLYFEKSNQDVSGEFSFYVPEIYNDTRSWPLVVALHGGYGSGRDFLWLWLREARSRGFLLLAPSSIGMTWSFQSDRDSRSINSIIDTISKQWNVNREKILLTGFSDGAIYSLTYGLQQSSPFTALAPISGVLHPIDLSYARDRKIYLVHGELDWMFPVDHAHRTYSVLKKAGANVFFQEVKGLSHTYPREVNDQILIWFDSSLSLSV